MFKRIDHIEIVTDKLDETVRFYTEVLGFAVRERDHVALPGAGEGLNLVYLDLGGTTVELLKFDGVPVAAEPAKEHLGYRLMALEVDDMKGAWPTSRQRGSRPYGVRCSVRPTRVRKSATPMAITSNCAIGSDAILGVGRA